MLNEILDAARWAPSWGNSQCCQVIVVRDAEGKKQLSQILSRKNPATLAVENAPVVIAVCAVLNKAGYYNGVPVTKFGDWFMYDLGLATQNICMAAHGLGLGSVIVGAFDHDRAKEILAVAEGNEVVVLVPLGYPDQQPPAPKRKSMEEFVHFDRFRAV
jgi:nitroreductase